VKLKQMQEYQQLLLQKLPRWLLTLMMPLHPQVMKHPQRKHQPRKRLRKKHPKKEAAPAKAKKGGNAKGGDSKFSTKQEKCELYYSTSTDMIIPRIVSDFVGHKDITLKKVNTEDLQKDKNLEKSHPALTTPYLKLASGEIISTHSGIA